jgi:hypothetical protein
MDVALTFRLLLESDDFGQVTVVLQKAESPLLLPVISVRQMAARWQI